MLSLHAVLPGPEEDDEEVERARRGDKVVETG